MIRWPCITQCPQDTVLLRLAFIDRTGSTRDRSRMLPGQSRCQPFSWA